MRRVIIAAAALVLVGGCAPSGPVRGWTETITIPTYPVATNAELPNFDRREVYPYGRQDDLSFEKRPVKYRAFMAENEYVRIEVLPEIGGRLFAMVDKVTGEDILYRQVSIKPGLVGLRGAWISGGIEWNFPRGHNVTTHDLVSCRMLRHDDGSVSIVVGDTERTFRMSWTVELRLRPGRARVETRIICRNPTPTVQKAGWWSNAGFPANDRTQVIFPFHKTTGHGPGGLSDWPIRNGEDVSWYGKHRRATSTFRAAGEEDFIAGYDHDRDVGLAQVADRRVMPGRKWWTWGVGGSGQRWATTLSDDGRPYLELQSGKPLTQGYQFDMQPHEEIEFLEYWMPVTRIGPPARINPEAIVRLTVEEGRISAGVLPTGRIDDARIELSAGKRLLKRWRQTISPAAPFKADWPPGEAKATDLWLRVSDAAGREVIAHRCGHYARGKALIRPRPGRSDENSPAGKLAEAIALTRHSSCTRARAILTGLLATSGSGVDADVVKYYLGVTEAALGRPGAAMRMFDAVSGHNRVRTAALIEGAKLLLAEGKWQAAVDRLKPLASTHAMAQAYTAMALRRAGRKAEAAKVLSAALRRDPLMLLGQVEWALPSGKSLDRLSALRDEQTRIEAATIYMNVRDLATADRLLRPAAGSKASATALYLRAHVAELAGNAPAAARIRKLAAAAGIRGCMPSRSDELAAFRAAVAADASDAGAHYLAGLVLYSWKRSDDAIAHWRRAGELDHPDAVVYHCMGRALLRANPTEAVGHYERASKMAPDAEGIYADLDSAYRRTGRTTDRIVMLRRAVGRLPDKPGLAHRLALALFDDGQYDKAVRVYRTNRFRVAEGRYGLHDDYAMALLGRATDHLAAGRDAKALADLDAALEYPENLGMGKPEWANGNATIHYWRGVALSRLGKTSEARRAWTLAAEQGGLGRRRRRGFRPERALHTAHAVFALRRTGQDRKAADLAARLLDACKEFEDYRPPLGKANADMIRGCLAAGRGREKESAAFLKSAAGGSVEIAGHLRLVRKWVELLKPASTP